MPFVLPQLLIVFLGGLAALSWQVLWQQDLALALGVSEQSAAITVAAVMSGMALGAWWAGRRWQHGAPWDPWVLYGCLEVLVGLLAWLPVLLLGPLQHLDAVVFRVAPSLATPFHALALAFTVGPSCVAMGATFPVIAIIAGRSPWSVSRFYAVNTAGAASGAMVAALILVPMLGRTGAAWAVTGLHTVAFVFAIVCSRSAGAKEGQGPAGPVAASHALTGAAAAGRRQAAVIALATGFCTFLLEVSHFRLLRAAWLNTTDSFAAMLFCFLIALALGAWICRPLKKTGVTLPVVLMIASIAVCLVTPLIERFDLVAGVEGDYAMRLVTRMASALVVIGLAVLPLGVPLPWLLDECRGPRDWAGLYALNTIGCVLGSIAAGWWLMAVLGPVASCWLAGGVLGATALWTLSGWGRRLSWAAGLAAALALASATGSGIGTRRAQAPHSLAAGGHEVLAHWQGSGSTTSVIASKDGSRWLLIDGYAATGESGTLTRYMDAMGRLPMLLHPAPKDALVICFGTGQTVRGVLDESPDSLTVVDVNPAVFRLAGFFKSNRQVLSDPRVHTHVMDGRAWLRRTAERYDVVTLEPMPPFFAGSNALYSVEFYDLIRSRLREGGLVAQWFPLHLMTPPHARAIAAAFVKVFPRCMLWFDPASRDRFGNLQQGVLIGCAGGGGAFDWPGFQRPADVRPLTRQEAASFVLLNSAQLAAYAGNADPVTDDNQLLSFGTGGLHKQNLTGESVTGANFNDLWQFQSSAAQ